MFINHGEILNTTNDCKVIVHNIILNEYKNSPFANTLIIEITLNIRLMWQAHYKNLLKSVDSSKSKESVERELHSIKDSAIVFGPADIFNAHKSTKTGKVCGVDGFAAERFIHASPIIYMYICLWYLIVLLHKVIYLKTL